VNQMYHRHYCPSVNITHTYIKHLTFSGDIAVLNYIINSIWYRHLYRISFDTWTSEGELTPFNISLRDKLESGRGAFNNFSNKESMVKIS